MKALQICVCVCVCSVFLDAVIRSRTDCVKYVNNYWLAYMSIICLKTVALNLFTVWFMSDQFAVRLR